MYLVLVFLKVKSKHLKQSNATDIIIQGFKWCAVNSELDKPEIDLKIDWNQYFT